MCSLTPALHPLQTFTAVEPFVLENENGPTNPFCVTALTPAARFIHISLKATRTQFTVQAWARGRAVCVCADLLVYISFTHCIPFYIYLHKNASLWLVRSPKSGPCLLQMGNILQFRFCNRHVTKRNNLISLFRNWWENWFCFCIVIYKATAAAIDLGLI